MKNPHSLGSEQGYRPHRVLLVLCAIGVILLLSAVCWYVVALSVGRRTVGTLSPLPPIAQLQAPTTAAEAYAAPKTGGVVAGQVLYTGPKVNRMVIATQGVTAMPVRIGTEDIIVNANGTLSNVVVFVKSGVSTSAPSDPPPTLTLDMNGYRFDPHVLALRAGQPVSIRNADPDAHSPRITGRRVAPFAFMMPRQGMSTTKRFAVPENGIAVADAIYPWMSAHICVFPHPFFNVTNSAGVFRLDELPPGEYVIEAWHEKLGAKQVKVSVIAGQVTRIVIRY